MGRVNREYYKGGIYHLLQRGINKAFIFDDQLDKAMFLNIVKETKEKYPFYFLYYVLMDNHYHLIIEMIDIDVSLIMRDINRDYSKYYNKKYSRTGTIYGNRNASYVVKDSKYFLKLLQYIAYNPVKAELVKKPSQYKWCAHMEMVSHTTSFIDKNTLLSHIETSFSKAMHVYLDIIDDKPTEEVPPDSVKSMVLERRKETLETLLYEIVNEESILSRIKTKSRAIDVIETKKQFISIAKSHGFNNCEIAKHLNMTRRGVNEYG